MPNKVILTLENKFLDALGTPEKTNNLGTPWTRTKILRPGNIKKGELSFVQKMSIMGDSNPRTLALETRTRPLRQVVVSFSSYEIYEK